MNFNGKEFRINHGDGTAFFIKKIDDEFSHIHWDENAVRYPTSIIKHYVLTGDWILKNENQIEIKFDK